MKILIAIVCALVVGSYIAAAITAGSGSANRACRHHHGIRQVETLSLVGSSFQTRVICLDGREVKL